MLFCNTTKKYVYMYIYGKVEMQRQEIKEQQKNKEDNNSIIASASILNLDSCCVGECAQVKSRERAKT